MVNVTPITPLEMGGEMFQRTKTPMIPDRATTASPATTSDGTEMLDTDFEDESEFEEDSQKRSFESEDGRRRSLTTISSYDEPPTPGSNRMRPPPLDLQSKPVQGPKGPHLFRSSQSSVELVIDTSLQMSPLLPRRQPLSPLPRAETGFSQETITPITRRLLLEHNMEAALAEPSPESDPRSIVRSWTPAQVLDWMVSWDIDASLVRCFEKHDIDGALLLDLQFEDLRDLDIESFGKRHQLWNSICILRGEEDASIRQPTPFQDTSRPCTSNSARRGSNRSRDSDHSNEDESTDTTPVDPASVKKRRGRKGPKNGDVVQPGESVSIVAIEQLLPKPHQCSKGERCAKWRKQQRQIQQLQNDNAVGRFPISPTKGGHIHITGDPGNAATAANIVPNVTKQRLEVPGQQQPRRASDQDAFRPVSEAVPSIVASSDLLGPEQMPAFALQADMLEKLDMRDPQDNVRQFLTFQHVQTSTEVPPTPPAELSDPSNIPRSHSVPAVPQMFPVHHHQAYPSLQRTASYSAASHDRLRLLPKLAIPGEVTSAFSASTCSNTVMSPEAATTPCRTAVSPAQIYRLGTPASEMDVPVTAVAQSPVSRDTSQSVPPNMHYRQPSPRSHSRNATADWRRPSMALPAVKEGEVFSPSSAAGTHSKRPSVTTHQSQNSTSSLSSASHSQSGKDPTRDSPLTQQFGYGTDCTYAGWMKKRKTKLLRHEWQQAHFRLTGTKLNMHQSARLSALLLDTVDIQNYAVSCSTVSSNSKLTAAMKAFHIREGDAAKKAAADPTAFAFQLVPSREEGRKFAAPTAGKTHHFAVKTKDERIDWMREVMIAKALQQKGQGYDIKLNGKQV